MIRATSGIQWGKAQIRVLEGGQVHGKNNFLKNDRYECRRNSCTTIHIVCSVFVFVPRVRVFRVSTDKGFSCDILFDIRVGSKNSTRPNLSRHQPRRLDHALSRTT
jgi:hypothetical protein